MFISLVNNFLRLLFSYIYSATFEDHIRNYHPRLLKKLNNIEDYSYIRAVLKSYGIWRFYFTEKVNELYLFNYSKLNVYEPATKNNTSINPNIPPDVLPFTFLYILPNKSDNEQECIPFNLRDKYAIVNNKPGYGGIGPSEEWDKAKHMEFGSMSMYHQFLVVRDTSADMFNALLFGLNLFKNSSNKTILNMLYEMDVIASQWAESKNIPLKYLGCFFHIYPNNSVNSLHMHMVDTREEHLGKAWKVGEYKNLPLKDLITYFRKN